MNILHLMLDKTTVTVTVPFSVTAVKLGFPVRSQARLLTLKLHEIALVVSCKSEQVAVVAFVTVGQVPQLELMLYCNVEQYEITGVQLNTSVPGWASAR